MGHFLSAGQCPVIWGLKHNCPEPQELVEKVVVGTNKRGWVVKKQDCVQSISREFLIIGLGSVTES